MGSPLCRALALVRCVSPCAGAHLQDLSAKAQMTPANRQVSREPRRDARWWLTLVLCVGIPVVVAFGLRTLKPEFADRTERSTLRNEDKIYLGSMVLPSDQGNGCRQLFFDNRTDEFKDAGRGSWPREPKLSPCPMIESRRSGH